MASIFTQKLKPSTPILNSKKKMELTDGDTSIKLNPQEAIALELKLNVSSKGHEWRHIGDSLFDFGSKKSSAQNFVSVSKEQMNFLQILDSKSSWEQCRGV